ncbi:class I SAM-dependent DNA methyltransferase [Marinomonas atlantica]|uniref:class I SAM-dependent DNA methyltransferase n=1 Tax=Marinomonas atlantica TaxID=1806668 RepID=UPI000829D949|nr:class I SAM-dependent methyltransferase [Marinomonas atlantica]
MDLKANTTLYYDTFAEDFAKSTLPVDMSALYQRFLPCIPPYGHILDAGCGSGRDAKYFQSIGHKISAFDASSELALIASNYLNIDVDVLTFQTFNESDLYDGIWCCASLLHVPKVELMDAISRLRKALKQNGILYMSFKHGDEERVKKGRFFCDQTEQTVRQYLEGFEVKDMWVTGDQREGRSSEQWLNIIVEKQE